MNIWVVNNMCTTWSTSFTPEIHIEERQSKNRTNKLIYIHKMCYPDKVKKQNLTHPLIRDQLVVAKVKK